MLVCVRGIGEPAGVMSDATDDLLQRCWALATGWIGAAALVHPRDAGGRAVEVLYLTMRIVRSIPSWVCSRPSWVFMKQAST